MIDIDLNRLETEEITATRTDDLQDFVIHQETHRIRINNDLTVKKIVEGHKIGVVIDRKKDERHIHSHPTHQYHRWYNQTHMDNIIHLCHLRHTYHHK